MIPKSGHRFSEKIMLHQKKRAQRKDSPLPIPVQFQGRLAIPAVAAPMFLVSNPDLVVEACRAGIIGTFPALNRRSSQDYEAWLIEIRERLDRIARDTGRPVAPFGVNLIVHKSNPRLQADLELSIKHKVPL